MNPAHLPRTMQAAILAELRKPLIVDEVELPRQLDVGQVLVKVHYSGICGSQLGEIDGVKGGDRYLPHLLGHEGSGTVLAVGPGVRQVKPNDLVVLHWRKGQGIEAKPPSYRWQGKTLNAGWVTTFNQYAIVSENRCTAIPAETDRRVAALFGCAVTTGFGVVENNAKLQIGESIVVFGAGGVGLNIVQASAMRGAYPIIAVDLYDNRLELAKLLGATHLVNGHRESPGEAITAIVEQQGLDVFVDNTGVPENIELGYRITKADGRVILVGVPAKGKDSRLYTLPLHFGKRLVGSHGGDGDPSQDIPRYLNVFSAGRMALREQVTNIFRLNEINQAVNRLRNGDVSGRVMIDLHSDQSEHH